MNQHQSNPFRPTALLVMEHNITGLKYFCKTSCVDRVKRYKGSGVAWTRHLKEHGTDVTVGVLGFYLDEQRCLDAAKKFSEDNDIVVSNGWANLIPETGKKSGSMAGERNPFYGKKHSPETAERIRLQKIGRSVNKGAYRSPEQRQKISEALKGRSNPSVSAALRGRKLTKEHILNSVNARKGYKHSMETREKLKQKALEQWAKARSKPADQPE